eukprot:CAMPEP_0198326820 /NCGR_PEP_ID=MMETSP1450-20131203/14240_1 /TAXON_ID=753684 ORGANISM="Madagascaria erythrocladiodes, Strain CCMP3234" /NCGR_SAMPLE_ID=MMETSP1450 /ASSEMBLY_ACC=CAM_ASM_001115 /LENGTH=305 /DNA_ID=CAMNT_0044030819 /DNA_START=271 /DNA_END=1188 /DNA_ORIENTATION=+
MAAMKTFLCILGCAVLSVSAMQTVAPTDMDQNGKSNMDLATMVATNATKPSVDRDTGIVGTFDVNGTDGVFISAAPLSTPSPERQISMASRSTTLHTASFEFKVTATGCLLSAVYAYGYTGTAPDGFDPTSVFSVTVNGEPCKAETALGGAMVGGIPAVLSQQIVCHHDVMPGEEYTIKATAVEFDEDGIDIVGFGLLYSVFTGDPPSGNHVRCSPEACSQRLILDDETKLCHLEECDSLSYYPDLEGDYCCEVVEKEILAICNPAAPLATDLGAPARTSPEVCCQPMTVPVHVPVNSHKCFCSV